jgi:hypothetical protein
MSLQESVDIDELLEEDVTELLHGDAGTGTEGQ